MPVSSTTSKIKKRPIISGIKRRTQKRQKLSKTTKHRNNMIKEFAEYFRLIKSIDFPPSNELDGFTLHDYTRINSKREKNDEIKEDTFLMDLE